MISLIILLWMCGWLVALGIVAKNLGRVEIGDIALSLLSSPLLPILPIVWGCKRLNDLSDVTIWRKK